MSNLHGKTLVLLGLAFVLSSTRIPFADDGTTLAKSKAKPNRLAKETSPYLLLHANNPVDWYPWGPEAFAKAKKEGKLIFLSVGYSSCYWCHVMERKVFMNEAIAKNLNRDYICIKVDREERPDIDDIYMTALQVYYQAIGAPSNGGWPLSLFLTPEGKPIAGGTYFPPEDTEGTQGFPTVIANLNDLWKNKRDQLLGNADIVANETQRLMRPKPSMQSVELSDKLVDIVFAASASSFDPDYGGIDFQFTRPDGPKFPTPAKLSFLQKRIEKAPNADVEKMLDMTLMQMASGGIRDHVGGGFHRYSVDRRWNVPHFEKMLYDQAQLANIYTRAYGTSKRPFYKQVVEETFDFVGREMTSPEGGFYSAIDAETNGVEGEFYVWDATEIDNVLGDAAPAFKAAYRVKDLSDFEHGNVLRLSLKRLPKTESANLVIPGKSEDWRERDEFTISRQKLLEVRNRRKKPLRDEKIQTGWNGLMITAYANAARQFSRPEYAKIAEDAANFVLTKLKSSDGRLLHSYAGGQAKLNAYLDDYAYLIEGLLALHDATDDPKWLKSAKQLQDEQLRNFLDEDNGGFFFTSHNHEELLARTKNCYDGVMPAGNSVSARNLIRLAKRTGTDAYLDEARATIELFVTNLEQSPRGYANLALATMELLETDGGEKPASTETTDASPAGDVVQASAKEGANDKEPLILLAEQKDDKAKPGAKKDDIVKGRAYLSTDKLPAGSTCDVVILIDVKEGWHVNSNPPSQDFLKPTVVEFQSKLAVEFTEVKYPKGHGFKAADSDEEISVYEGEVQVRGKLTVPEKAGGQTDEMEITIKYQPCNDKGCLPPKSIKLVGKLAVAKKGEAVKPINGRLFNSQANASK